ncbi:MAG TPA: GNAT family N-acetyltransferase [Vicinamibacteria bacterium]|jgi:GNAT superfamily N-acetyltransferase
MTTPGVGGRPLAGGDRRPLAPLFAAHAALRAVVEAALEGSVGTVRADDAEAPRAARISVGCYELFGGDPDALRARDLVATATPERELIYGNDPAWRRLLLDVHGARLGDRPMRAFDASGLSRDALRALASRLPAGFSMAEIDATLAGRLDAALEPHALQVYASAEAFAAHGIGFGVRAGDDLAAAATSYARSATAVEVAIATRPAFRGQGLAAAAAARLMLACLEAGLTPCWNASNPVSQRLAERLGYRPAGTCEVLYLR